VVAPLLTMPSSATSLNSSLGISPSSSRVANSSSSSPNDAANVISATWSLRFCKMFPANLVLGGESGVGLHARLARTSALDGGAAVGRLALVVSALGRRRRRRVVIVGGRRAVGSELDGELERSAALDRRRRTVVELRE